MCGSRHVASLATQSNPSLDAGWASSPAHLATDPVRLCAQMLAARACSRTDMASAISQPLAGSSVGPSHVVRDCHRVAVIAAAVATRPRRSHWRSLAHRIHRRRLDACSSRTPPRSSLTPARGWPTRRLSPASSESHAWWDRRPAAVRCVPCSGARYPGGVRGERFSTALRSGRRGQPRRHC
jgi:hypothetical protein